MFAPGALVMTLFAVAAQAPFALLGAVAELHFQVTGGFRYIAVEVELDAVFIIIAARQLIVGQPVTHNLHIMPTYVTLGAEGARSRQVATDCFLLSHSEPK